MLQQVDVGERALAAYRGVAPDELLDELETVAAPLRGLRVLHVNATAYGGGVSELLRSIVPVLRDLGLIADWKVISGDQAFFEVTKAIHNGLQGAPGELDERQRAIYLDNSRSNAARLQERYDIVFVHDPQPAALLALHGDAGARWVWRCHIDTAQPNPDFWSFLRQYLAGYHAAIFTMAEFVAPDVPIDRVEVFPPAIDPLSPKNLPLPEATARQVLGWIGVDPNRPLVSQVSRFDPWKDPMGVIAAYHRVREEVPHLQLALVGSMALDDPEGWGIYREITAAAADDPLIHVFTNLTGVGNVEVNAFQRLSDVVVQKSIREGFGLVISEALWKGTPVVAGRAGGIPLQMADGVGGVLVDDVDGCAAGILTLLHDPARAAELARAGRERVRRHFLLPRILLNEVALMADLVREGPAGTPESADAVGRDPVCGMALDPADPGYATVFDGVELRFCSRACRVRFESHPARYRAQLRRAGS